MAVLKNEHGVVVSVADSKVARLGPAWTPVEPEKKPAPKATPKKSEN